VVCRDPNGGLNVGTGYRVTNDTVLTAGHLMAGEVDCVLRFPVASVPWETTAEVAALDVDTDVAVLRFSPPAEAEVVTPVRFGRVTPRPAVLDVETVGFPEFKLRHVGNEVWQRDTAHLPGTTSSLTNVSSGTLSIRVVAAPADHSPSFNPWAGMSGAPVWSDGLLIGVVNAELRAEGPGTLGATRIERFFRADPGLSELLGLPEPLHLPEVPAPVLQPVSPYLAHVQDIAPQRLTGREKELTALAEFCRGELPYAVWRGQPWSGKTALAAWFALHPPQDVDVAAFFVTARLVGQSDSTAFTDALVDQLGLYLGQDLTAHSTPTGALEMQRRQMLSAAARKADQERRRLLLVVDGIDEDSGPSSGLPSIASLLPVNPPRGLRVLVTGRRVPLPDDVPVDHPLRTSPEVLLAPAPDSLPAAREANAELLALLTASEVQRDILGLIAVADDFPLPGLADIVAMAPYELTRLMNGPLGRLLVRSDAEAPATGSVRFAHPALREEVRRMLGVRLVRAYAARLEDHRKDLGGDPWADPAYNSPAPARNFPTRSTSSGDSGT
jgi:hypothetical protein